MLNLRKKGSASYVAIVILLVLSLVITALTVWPRPQNHEGDNPLLKGDGNKPLLVAHRGGAGEFPGNTLEAFYNAYSVDENVVMETDINLTADGVLILCHDTTLDRTTNVNGEVRDWTYADLIEQKVNFGYYNKTEGEKTLFVDEYGEVVHPSTLGGEYSEGLPGRDKEIFIATTLEELLVAFPGNIISIEIKQSGETGFLAVKEALRLVEKYDAFDRIIFASFHEEIYEEYQRLQREGEVPETFMCSPATGGMVKYYALYLFGLDMFFGDSISVLQIPMSEYGISLATTRLIKNAHKHNIATHYWTINDVEDMVTLVELGADAIMTDYPHKLGNLLDSMYTE